MNAKTSSGKSDGNGIIAKHRKAWHEYDIEKTYQAGIALLGWEVKSLRDGRCQLVDSYVLIKDGEAFLIGAHITPLLSASTHIDPDPLRTRKLLLHANELSYLIGQVQRKGYALIPLQLYWKGNKIKLDIGLAKGKKQHDKRATLKERDWVREQQRTLKTSANFR